MDPVPSDSCGYKDLGVGVPTAVVVHAGGHRLRKRGLTTRIPRFPVAANTGSWDFSVGTVATRQTLRWEVDTSLSYKFNSEANDFDFGDQARLDLSYQYRMSPRELGEGVPGFLYGVLESNLIWQDRNAVGGVQDPSSGGLTWFLVPGLQYGSRRYIIEAAVQIPVVQDLHGAALENDYIATLSTRVNF